MIYVDPLRHHPVDEHTNPKVRRFKLWCHLFADDVALDDLHGFAKSIGLRREWFQDRNGFPHYDLTRRKRHFAMKAGAVEVELKEWLK